MNPIEAALRRAVDDLRRNGVPWALIGGFAVSARTEPRFTRDIDIAVALDEDHRAEALVRSLIGSGYRMLASIEQDETGRLATVRLTSPLAGEVDVVVDLLFASSGVEDEIAQSAEPIELVPSLVVPVARTGYLIALKLLSRNSESRPRDDDDLNALIAAATTEDIEMASEAVRLISQRGYDRGRNLPADLEALLHRTSRRHHPDRGSSDSPLSE